MSQINAPLQVAVLRALKHKNKDLVLEVKRKVQQGAGELAVYLAQSGWQSKLQGVTFREVWKEVEADAELHQRYESRGRGRIESGLLDDLAQLYDESVIRAHVLLVRDVLMVPVSMYQMLCAEDVEAASMLNAFGSFLSVVVVDAGQAAWSGALDSIREKAKEVTFMGIAATLAAFLSLVKK